MQAIAATTAPACARQKSSAYAPLLWRSALPRTKSASCCAHGACLATRVPTGEELTREKVDLIRACEDYLHDLGLAQVRARLVGGCMHIEAAPADVTKIAVLGGAAVDGEGKTPLPAAIESALRELGCGHISPEVTPYIHGNMNL